MLGHICEDSSILQRHVAALLLRWTRHDQFIRASFLSAGFLGGFCLVSFLCNLLKWDLPGYTVFQFCIYLRICSYSNRCIAPGRCLTGADSRQRHFITTGAFWFTASLWFILLWCSGALFRNVCARKCAFTESWCHVFERSISKMSLLEWLACFQKKKEKNLGQYLYLSSISATRWNVDVSLKWTYYKSAWWWWWPLALQDGELLSGRYSRSSWYHPSHLPTLLWHLLCLVAPFLDWCSMCKQRNIVPSGSTKNGII